MTRKFWRLAGWTWVLAAVIMTASLHAQEVAKIIDLDDGDSIPDYPFGLKLTRDGGSLYVAVAGTFSTSNNRIVEIDTVVDAVVGDGKAGLFPEEVEIRYDGNGSVEKIFVSNSSDGSVSVLNADLSPDGLVDLKPAGGLYPFGLLMGPQSRYLYVTTVDVGKIFRIDTEPGPTYLDIMEIQGSVKFNSRMALHDGRLVIAGSDDVLGAVVSILDPSIPAIVDTIVLDSILSGWPSGIDVAIEDDNAYVTVLDYNGSGLLYEVDLMQLPPLPYNTIDLNLNHSYILEHGIGASPDGNTLVVACIDGPLIFVGRKTGCVLGEIDLAAFGSGQGNEAVFSHDGNKLYVTDQGDPSVYVLTGVPEHGLILTGTESASMGGAVELNLRGGQPDASGWLIASLSSGPIMLPGFTLDLGLPLKVFFRGRFGQDCGLVPAAFKVPGWPGIAPSTTVYVQGLTRDSDGEIRPSNLHEILIL
jgi:DNA-binding beta-propeller fold protein YncE